MSDFAEGFFRALSDPTRLRCLMLLEREGELCVCELTHALHMVQPKISRHLAQLREAGVVIDRRQGQWVHYQIAPDLPAWAREVLKSSARGLATSARFAADRRTLREMPNRPVVRHCG